MPAIIYTRVSTERQEKEATAESQEREAKAFAKAKQLTIARIAREQHTGAEMHERPVLSQVREAIRNREIDTLICHSVDRLSRDAAHLMILYDECERAGVKMEFVTEEFDTTPEGKLMLSVKGFVAEVERLKIRERTMRGRRQRVERGKLINASTPLYGYSQDKETSARTIKPEEARIVRRIWDEAKAGFGTVAIAERLNAESIPCPAVGKRVFKNGQQPLWRKSSIRRILREPAYAGMSVAFRWARSKKRDVKYALHEQPIETWITLPDSLTPAIVEREEFDEMQALIMERKAGDVARNQLRPCLLRGLIFCARCDRRRIPDFSSYSYRCGSRYSGAGRCGSSSTPMKMVERWAWEQFVGEINQPDWLQQVLSANPERDEDREVMQARLRELEATIAKLTGQQQRLLTNLADAEGELARMVAGQVKALDVSKRTAGKEAETIRQKLQAPEVERQNWLLLVEQARIAINGQAFKTEDRYKYLQGFGVKVSADGRDGWRFEMLPK